MMVTAILFLLAFGGGVLIMLPLTTGAKRKRPRRARPHVPASWDQPW